MKNRMILTFVMVTIFSVLTSLSSEDDNVASIEFCSEVQGYIMQTISSLEGSTSYIFYKKNEKGEAVKWGTLPYYVVGHDSIDNGVRFKIIQCSESKETFSCGTQEVRFDSKKLTLEDPEFNGNTYLFDCAMSESPSLVKHSFWEDTSIDVGFIPGGQLEKSYVSIEDNEVFIVIPAQISTGVKKEFSFNNIVRSATPVFKTLINSKIKVGQTMFSQQELLASKAAAIRRRQLSVDSDSSN